MGAQKRGESENFYFFIFHPILMQFSVNLLSLVIIDGPYRKIAILFSLKRAQIRKFCKF